ncbi:L,D-transpeptidase [Lysobacter ciconiae]|uniref:L,D-transpeptidase n=1 Tax=Novilysobacter ciconiae TaxID=2781022 RepID=A0A7S6UG00_9GAMM|nr:L,D-transpeptidase [Lysobacter ciconiae]QOW19581.1 L,D-transpeptidase [Lysobacter ciconiae]
MTRSLRMRGRMAALALGCAVSGGVLAQEPIPTDAGAATPLPTSTVRLEAGEYLWMPEMAPAGPVVLVISLPEQLLHVYRNGVRIGVSTVSTGKAGHETPTGVFSILQKRKEHYSNLYNNAPMPYMQRLTWDGIALHAGNLPGYPASHGCVRMPFEFSQKLYGVTANGMTVVVANESSHSPSVSYPGWFAPVDPVSGADARGHRVEFGDIGPGEYSWNPERAPHGALTLVLSLADQQLVTMRNGVEIGRASVTTRSAQLPGTHVYVLLEGEGSDTDVAAATRPALRWLQVASIGGGDSADAAAIEAALGHGGVQLPPGFADAVQPVLQPGSTVVVTSESIRGTAPADLTVLRADEDPAAPPPDGD